MAPSTPNLPAGVTDDLLLEMFRAMVVLRTYDERAQALQRQGRIGNYPPFWGEEATQVGPLFACEPDDWLFPSYRQNAIAALRGLKLSSPLKYRRGLGGAHGFFDPRQVRVAPPCIPIGTHLQHAVGTAWAAKIRSDPVASLVWFGDGATSEGDFHEAMNFAAVFKVPAVFFCTNNQWAISTPVTRQAATGTMAERVPAYAMPGFRVDGFDPIACFLAVRDALARARRGEGPTLIEAFCYRIGPHASADDPSLYRDPKEAERWRRLEPLGRMRARLFRRGLLEEDGEKALREEADRLVADAVAEMESVARPHPDVLFAHTYASDRPWTLREQQSELEETAGPHTFTGG